MNTRFDFDRKNSRTGNSIRTVVAALCVIGLVCWLTLLHGGADGGLGDEFAQATTPAGPVAETTSSLRAPTSDPSLPSLEATFSRTSAPPVEDPPAPTF